MTPDKASSTFSICVYCGSRPGTVGAYAQQARQVGQLIAERGWQLVYGGGHCGLMGEVADGALDHGGRVIGVIPQSLVAHEVGHRGLTELHVVDNMHDRKRLMAERADAFLALPGGIGTFEELFEVWTWRQLGYHSKPIGLLNVAGYYDALLDFMQHTVRQGFLSPSQLAQVVVDTAPASMLDSLREQAATLQAGDYSRI
ncbi:TIGR00730 family Rossman fold protein [Aquabacterium sp.]|uniref:LOG family protein n=1 Tax=Aquabacterium sp. TaxID=1872578 RepID=UPI0035B286D7